MHISILILLFLLTPKSSCEWKILQPFWLCQTKKYAAMPQTFSKWDKVYIWTGKTMQLEVKTKILLISNCWNNIFDPFVSTDFTNINTCLYRVMQQVANVKVEMFVFLSVRSTNPVSTCCLPVSKGHNWHIDNFSVTLFVMGKRHVINKFMLRALNYIFTLWCSQYQV